MVTGYNLPMIGDVAVVKGAPPRRQDVGRPRHLPGIGPGDTIRRQSQLTSHLLRSRRPQGKLAYVSKSYGRSVWSLNAQVQLDFRACAGSAS